MQEKTFDDALVVGEPLTSIWDDVLSNNLHNKGDVEFPKGKKPEALIKRCLDLATSPGDIVSPFLTKTYLRTFNPSSLG